jgi:hypothetical protein
MSADVVVAVNEVESFEAFLSRQTDRELLLFAIHKMAAIDERVDALMQYVKDLDNKARAFGDPANMEKIMSGMLGNMMGM